MIPSSFIELKNADRGGKFQIWGFWAETVHICTCNGCREWVGFVDIFIQSLPNTVSGDSTVLSSVNLCFGNVITVLIQFIKCALLCFPFHVFHYSLCFSLERSLCLIILCSRSAIKISTSSIDSPPSITYIHAVSAQKAQTWKLYFFCSVDKVFGMDCTVISTSPNDPPSSITPPHHPSFIKNQPTDCWKATPVLWFL